jgi:hypothetical protein
MSVDSISLHILKDVYSVSMSVTDTGIEVIIETSAF